MTPETAHATSLKVCGITRREDMQACCELGVPWVGINLWPKSRRGLSIDAAKNLLAPFTDLADAPRRVGVFVDASPEEITASIVALKLDIVQLHGDRPFDDYAQIDAPLVWVIRGTPNLHEIQWPRRTPEWVLLDAMVAGYGGEGARTDWAWAADFVAASKIPVWLAGGITPENAALAIETVRPVGLDVASGAEISGARAGEKDPQKIAALVNACRLL